MIDDRENIRPIVKPIPLVFLLGLLLVNGVAVFRFDPLYIGSFFSFLYIVVAPGTLLLPFFLRKRIPVVLGIMYAAAFSVLLLILLGLGVNTFLPFFGIAQPLTTLPLLLAFDALIYVLLILNFIYKKAFPFEIPIFNPRSIRLLGVSLLLPLFACMSAISLNNGGSPVLSMMVYGISALIILVIVTGEDAVNSSLPPLSLYLMALSFLLLNSMRGWFITGHDILLEYHVFILTNNAKHWSMALYQDPYTACLSITIFPVYLQNLLTTSGVYLFKFFLQFINAAAVIAIYYLAREYVSKTTAFLAGVVYITFPTFMTDMAFLNRQGIALLFFASILLILLTDENIGGSRRNIVLFLLGIGMVLSHYSTSYVAISLFIGAYVINYAIRFMMNVKRPHWLSRATDRIASKEMHRRPNLIPLSFIIGLFCIIFLWSGVITKTSNNVSDTIRQIGANLSNPFSSDLHAGVDAYSLVRLAKQTPQAMFNNFVQTSIQQTESSIPSSDLFPLNVALQYPIAPSAEPIIPITALGQSMIRTLHIDLVDFYSGAKQWYAYIMQFLLLVGLAGLAIGYSFKKHLLHNVPREYIAISASGILILVGQTLLPSSAVDYGLLRLFQQNLTLLGLPIVLGLLLFLSAIMKSHKKQLFAFTVIMLAFFLILSGFIPELTGGGRPALTLNNYGLYYDIYYSHAEEVSGVTWIYENANPGLTIQSDRYSSTIKMLAYTGIGTLPGLLPATIQRNTYVYLNYGNVKTGNVVEYVNGDVVYYRFPMNFLQTKKSLVYNNGGSEVYQ